MNKNDYEIQEKDFPKKFDKWLYFKQRGYINVFLKVIYYRFLKRVVKKKIVKFKTPYNTHYNGFRWDLSAPAAFVSNYLPEWGNEYFFIHTLKNREKGTLLDAGCHTGYFSCLLNNHFKKIIGFEPSIKCVEALELLKKEYNNFIYYNCFLGDLNKTVMSKQYEDGYAFVQENMTEVTSLKLQLTKDHEKYETSQEKIEIKTIDDIISKNHNSEKVSGIKIDVDGLDLDVLKGGMKIIKRDRPSIYIEQNGQELFLLREFLSLMKEINYKVFAFVSNINKPYNICLKEITSDDNKYWYSNNVCVPAEHVPKNLYTKEIKGNFLFGLNKKVILEKFS
tara:strand:+ start:1155 stop:2162 length:1008 start_codon:yes stop_codon:yes gene_type:complete